MPAYNESKTLDQIVDKVFSQNFGLDIELIIVNDGSKDNTWEIIENLAKENKNIKGVQNPKNIGKSQTVKHGISHTTGDLVVIQDADLEYDPQDLIKFVDKFQKEDLDVIYGNRFGKENKVIYWQNWFGNRLLSLFSAIFTGLRSGMWTWDMEVCYKMAKGDIFREIGSTIVSTSTFGLEPEMTAKFAKYRLNGKKLKFAQIPISYFPRSIAEGKKMHAVKDGLKALWEILKFNLAR